MAARSVLGLACAGFIALGLPEGAFGVAWPSIAEDRSRRLGELGWLLALYTVGYLLSTLSNGRLMRRFGLGRMLPVSSAGAATALGVYAVGGAWPALLGATVLLGFAGGLIDAGMNAYAALTHGSRVMNLLHAGYGLGATLGPLAMTIALEAASWQGGYGLLAAVQAGLALAFWWTRSRWNVPVDIVTRRRPGRHGTVLPLSLLVFFLYGGVEVAVGQWSFTLFTEGRRLGVVAAGVLVTGYWGSFTLGRVIAAGVGDRGRPESMFLAGMLSALVGALLLWSEPVGWLGGAGLLAMGMSLAPIFPLLTLLTPGRLGSDFAPTAIGYQLAAATVGAAVIPGTLGLAVEQFGVDAIGPGIVGWTAALVAAGSALAVLAGRRASDGRVLEDGF